VIVTLTKWNWVRAYDQPLYLYYDFEDKKYRIKAYESTATYIDDTATNTDRTGAGEIRLYDMYPFTIPASLTKRSITVEIYNTSNVKQKTLTLDYYAGSSYITIYYRDAKTDTYVTGKIHALCQIDPPLFVKTTGSSIAIPPSTPTLIEFIGAPIKYYDIRTITLTANATIQVTQADTYDIEIVVKIDLELMKRLLYETAVSPTASQHIYNQLPNRPDLQYLLATRLLRELGTTIPIKNAYLDSNYNLHIVVTQDVIPLLPLIIKGILVIAGMILAYYIVKQIINIFLLSNPTTLNNKLIEYETNRLKIIADLAKNACSNLTGDAYAQCVENISKGLGGENTTLLITQTQKRIEDLKKERDKYKYVAVTTGAVAGLALITRGGTTIIEKR
jgi:hypothetical protein